MILKKDPIATLKWHGRHRSDASPRPRFNPRQMIVGLLVASAAIVVGGHYHHETTTSLDFKDHIVADVAGGRKSQGEGNWVKHNLSLGSRILSTIAGHNKKTKKDKNSAQMLAGEDDGKERGLSAAFRHSNPKKKGSGLFLRAPRLLKTALPFKNPLSSMTKRSKRSDGTAPPTSGDVGLRLDATEEEADTSMLKRNLGLGHHFLYNEGSIDVMDEQTPEKDEGDTFHNVHARVTYDVFATAHKAGIGYHDDNASLEPLGGHGEAAIEHEGGKNDLGDGSSFLKEENAKAEEDDLKDAISNVRKKKSGVVGRPARALPEDDLPFTQTLLPKSNKTSKGNDFGTVGPLVYFLSLLFVSFVVWASTRDMVISSTKKRHWKGKKSSFPSRASKLFLRFPISVICALAFAASIGVWAQGSESNVVQANNERFDIRDAMGKAEGSSDTLNKSSDPAMEDDGMEMERAIEDDSKPFTLDGSMKDLESLSRSLRGGGAADQVDTAGILSQVKEFATSYLSGIEVIQSAIQDGHKDRAGAALKSFVGNEAALATSKRAPVALGNNFDFFGPDEGVTVTSANADPQLAMGDFSDAQLAEYMKPQVFDQIHGYVEDLLGILDPAIAAIERLKKQREEEPDWQQESHQGFKFDSDTQDYGSGFDGGQHYFHGSNEQFRPEAFLKHFSSEPRSHSDFSKHPYAHQARNILRQHQNKAGMGSHATMFRPSSFFERDEIIMARHQARKDALGEKVCAVPCNEADWECNCKELFTCVKDMSEYDLAVLIAGGYIDTTPGSDSYGNFSISVRDLSLFDADEGVSTKLARIKAKIENTIDKKTCDAVLEELFTACEPSKMTCDDPNTQSFQLSTEQVCAGVNTRTKLLFEVIGDEFDGFQDKSSEPKDKPLSYDVCAEFVTEFDRLYEARDPSVFRLSNPMRKDPSVALHSKRTQEIFDHVQFPTSYWFPQDKRTGIANRTSFDVGKGVAGHFAIVNPNTGKALGLNGRCDRSTYPHGPRIEVLDHDPTDPDQRFSFTDDGNIVHAECTKIRGSTMALTPGKSWGCGVENGAALFLWSLDDGEKFESQAMQWRIGTDRQLVSKFNNCPLPNEGTLVLSSIADDKANLLPNEADVSFVNPSSGLALAATDCNAGAPVTMKTYSATDRNQRFRLKNLGDKYSTIRTSCSSDLVFKVDSDRVILGPPGLDRWEIVNGKIIQFKGSVGEKPRVIGINYASVEVMEDDKSSEQKWTVKSHNAVALPRNGDDGDLQEWTAYFENAPYNYALMLGFPGGPSGSPGGPPKPPRSSHTWDFEGPSMNGFTPKDGDCGLQPVPYKIPGVTDWWGDHWRSPDGGKYYVNTFLKYVNGQFKPDKKYKCAFWDRTNVFTIGHKTTVAWEWSGTGSKVSLHRDRDDKELLWRWVNLPTRFPDAYQVLQANSFSAGELSPHVGEEVYLLFTDEGKHDTNQLEIDNIRVSNADFRHGADFGETLEAVQVREGEEDLIDSDAPQCSATNPCVDGRCCSRYGYCGSGEDFCGEGCRSHCGKVSCGQHEGWGCGDCPPKGLANPKSFCNGECSWKNGICAPTRAPTPNPTNLRPTTVDAELSKAAMHYCDESMSLLVGSQTSVGTLRATAKIVEEKGMDRMPGRCCFDTPTTNDKYFGISHDPNLMKCQHTGPWHLGITEEACENAGGMWFRTPCVTLKEAIDGRPARFDLVNGTHGSCQDAFQKLTVAYVSASSDHAEFPPDFERNEHGCNAFCQGLPGYANQAAMMTELSSSSSAYTCSCFYQNGKVPRADSLTKKYATSSPPSFYLTNPSDGSRLGLSSGYDCASGEISIEALDPVESVRQQFQLSKDHRIVSAACPGKVLTAECGDPGGKIVSRSPDFGQDARYQQWNIRDDGKITSLKCPKLSLSSKKEVPGTIESPYFSLLNPTTSLVMGIEGSDCVDGTEITVKKAVPGSPAQLFYTKEGSGKIFSLMCPDFVIAESGDVCNSTSLQLKTKESARSEWQFKGDDSIESSTDQCTGKVIDIQIGGRKLNLNAKAGAALILSEHTSDSFSMYQRWMKSRQKTSVLSGPYSFRNSVNARAMSVTVGDCESGLSLAAQKDDSGSEDQTFYIGNSGTIHSAKCPGFVVSINRDMTCDGAHLQLQTNTGDNSTQWTFHGDGSIESVRCQGSVIDMNAAAAGWKLELRQNISSEGQMWRKVNTRLLAAGETSWNQKWSVDFVQEYDGALPPQNNDASVKTCYKPNAAFSASFENFAKPLVIVDASDEKECRKAREGLGFDKDHPFDTGVRDTFNDLMCNEKGFTAADDGNEVGFTEADDEAHGGLAEPPIFTEVDFEAPEYPDDPELNFDALPAHNPWPEHPVAPGIGEDGTTDRNPNAGPLENLFHSINAIGNLIPIAEHVKDLLEMSAETVCGIIAKSIAAAWAIARGAAMPFGDAVVALLAGGTAALETACLASIEAVNMAMLSIISAAQIALQAMQYQHDLFDISVPEVIDTYIYTYQTFHNLRDSQEWNFKALQTINRNIVAQHSEMRQHLQDRHQDMTTDIVEFIEQSTNILGGEFNKQNKWLDEILCQMYKQAGASSCEGTGESLSDLVVEWPAGHTTLSSKMQQLEAQGESMEGKVDAVEGKVDAVEGKVAAVEGKVDAVEGKVDAVEGKVDAMMGMLMQLLDQSNILAEKM